LHKPEHKFQKILRIAIWLPRQGDFVVVVSKDVTAFQKRLLLFPICFCSKSDIIKGTRRRQSFRASEPRRIAVKSFIAGKKRKIARRSVTEHAKF
jgi:hypothetical protein